MRDGIKRIEWKRREREGEISEDRDGDGGKGMNVEI